jgi:hypothetical protein
MNEKSPYSKPHPKVHWTIGGNTRTTFPLSSADSEEEDETANFVFYWSWNSINVLPVTSTLLMAFSVTILYIFEML